jgi:hypothetical protein
MEPHLHACRWPTVLGKIYQEVVQKYPSNTDIVVQFIVIFYNTTGWRASSYQEALSGDRAVVRVTLLSLVKRNIHR